MRPNNYWNLVKGLTGIGLGLVVTKELSFSVSMSDLRTLAATIFNLGSNVPVCGGFELLGENEVRPIARTTIEPKTNPGSIPIELFHNLTPGRMSKNKRNLNALPSKRQGKVVKEILTKKN